MVKFLIAFFSLSLVYYSYFFARDLLRNRKEVFSKGKKFLVSNVIGGVTEFFDTFGIGSFAPTVVLLNGTKSLKSDRLMPGTLNVGHTIPVVLKAFIFIQLVKVAPLTLFSMVISAVVGSVVGARIVRKLPNEKTQLVMGCALFLTALLMICKQLKWFDVLGQGNTAIGLTGLPLVVAVVVNFILGGLMTAGVGLYAPCMALVFVLGLSPEVAFPVMMASCAGVMPVASVEFIKKEDYARVPSVGICLGGILGTWISITLFKNISFGLLTWIVILVILYTAFLYVRKGLLYKKTLR